MSDQANKNPDLSSAFVTAVDNTYKRMFKLALGYTLGLGYANGNQQDAEDIVSDAISSAWKRCLMGNAEVGEGFPGFLMRAVRWSGLDYLKRRHREPPQIPWELVPDDLQGDGGHESTPLIILALRDCVQALPERERIVVAMWNEGYPHEEIKEKLNISLALSQKITERTKKKLKDCIPRRMRELERSLGHAADWGNHPE